MISVVILNFKKHKTNRLIHILMKYIITLILLLSIPAALTAQLPVYSWRYYRPGNTGIQGDNATALWVDENGDPYIAANTGNWGEGGFARFSQIRKQMDKLFKCGLSDFRLI